MKTDTKGFRILVVDDEVQIRRMLRLVLEEAGYRVDEAENGQRGLGAAVERKPDVIILDLGLPDLNGIEVLRQLRVRSPVPVLILSVLGQEDRKIAGLDAGADDYLTKPFSDGELLARIRVLLRRNQPAGGLERYHFGPVEVDLAARLVSKAGGQVKLTSKEFDLLRLFILNRDKVLTHRTILRELWGPKSENQTHYLRTYIMRLRRKLEEPDQFPGYFQSESGVGYRFVGEPEVRSGD